MTPRYVRYCTALAVMLAYTASLPAEETAPPPAKLTGTLWWISPADAEAPLPAWSAELDAMQALGMDTLVVNGPYADEALFDTLLPETDRRHMRVFIDTLQAPQWWELTDPNEEINRAKERMDRLYGRCNAHPSFAGWYIPYELYVFWDAQADLIARLYGEIAAHGKTLDSARQILISPFFILDRTGVLGSFRWAEPAEYAAFWTKLLQKASDIDIVALQDSGEHLSFYTFDDRRPFFEAMAQACQANGVTFWANLESAELEVSGFDDYAARFGAGTHVNDPRTEPYWHAVPADRFVSKLRFAGRYCDTALTWGYREFLRPSAGIDAANVYESYKAALDPAK